MTPPVVIAATNEQCVAHRALYAEGLQHRVEVLDEEDRFAYGRLVTDLWAAGDGLVLVEDDVAPWPGALAQLQECPEDWCGFDYSIGFARFGAGTLGCWKASRRLTLDYPESWKAWNGQRWHDLDSYVTRELRAITGLHRFHEHTPPVAHAKHFRL